MRLTLRTILILLLLCSAAFATPQQAPPGKASIEGVVLRSGSGEPLARAQVTLRRIPEQQEAEIPRVLTQDDGKFSFQNLEPGQFDLTVARNGYARQVYGQRIAGGRGNLIFLIEGQVLRGVTFRMVPGGVITGRVRDSRGEPIAGYQVFLMKSEYTPDGKRRLTEAAESVTDDRGEYRLYWIPPGRYYLLANEFAKKDGPGPGIIPDQVFPSTYYPGVMELSRAGAIDMRPGGELGAMDILLQQPAVYHIRGRVVDGSTGRPPPAVDLTLSSRSMTEAIIDDRKNYTTRYDAMTGVFEVRNVFPGEYWLSAVVVADKGEAFVAVALGKFIDLLPRALAQAPIDLTTSDVNDVILTLGNSVNIPVRLRIEGDSAPVVRSLDEIEIGLRPVIGTLLPENGANGVQADGTSTISRVVPGDYRVVVHVPESMALYTREATHQRTDALNDTWQITQQTSEPLEVILSSRGGQIEGELRNTLNQPAPGVQVVLVPDLSRQRLDLYKRTTTDPEGRFLFRGIAPGGYKVFAWEAIEDFAYYHSDVLSPYETQGVPVRVQESSKATVNVRLIPGPQPQ